MNISHDIKNEIESLRVCRDHRNIVNLIEYMEDHLHKYIVLEILEGGELYNRIQRFKNFQESEAKVYFQQLVLAVQFMHSKGIIHRDLKPENVMFVDDTKKSELKIVDFGFACRKSTKEMIPRFTLDYAAPESLQRGVITESQDIWSLGAILYTMLCGNSPFMPMLKPADDKSRRKMLIENIRKGEFNTHVSNWRMLSGDVKDLIGRTLCVNEKSRLSIDEILSHNWLQPEQNGVDYSRRIETPKIIEIRESSERSISSTNSLSDMNDQVIPTKINGCKSMKFAKQKTKGNKRMNKNPSKLKNVTCFDPSPKVNSKKLKQEISSSLEETNSIVKVENSPKPRKLRSRQLNGKTESQLIINGTTHNVRTKRRNLKRKLSSNSTLENPKFNYSTDKEHEIEELLIGFSNENEEDKTLGLGNWREFLFPNPTKKIKIDEDQKSNKNFKKSFQHHSNGSFYIRVKLTDINGKYFPSQNAKKRSIIEERRSYLKRSLEK
jgi:serine/threonine protein kinase